MSQHKKPGRPEGTKMRHPRDPARVAVVVRMRKESASYQTIAKELGISRVAVRLLYLRWKDHPSVTGFTAAG